MAAAKLEVKNEVLPFKCGRMLRPIGAPPPLPDKRFIPPVVSNIHLIGSRSRSRNSGLRNDYNEGSTANLT